MRDFVLKFAFVFGPILVFVLLGLGKRGVK